LDTVDLLWIEFVSNFRVSRKYCTCKIPTFFVCK